MVRPLKHAMHLGGSSGSCSSMLSAHATRRGTEPTACHAERALLVGLFLRTRGRGHEAGDMVPRGRGQETSRGHGTVIRIAINGRRSCID